MKKTGKGSALLEALLAWCKQKTQGYQGVDVQNFSASWRDGLAMCALVHAIRPSLIAWDNLGKDEIGNLNLAFAAAEKIGVPRLLDAEDMFPGPPEPFSMITYLSTLFHAASKIEPSSQASTTPARPAEPERPKTTAAVQPASNFSQRSPAPSISTTAKSTPTGPSATPPTQINGASCHKCGKAASGMMVDWADNLFHQECFKCSGCNRPFRKTCLNIDGLPYCDGCGRKAFVQSRLLRHGLATSDTPSQSPSAASNNDSTSSNSNILTSTASNGSRTSTLSPTAAAAKTGSTTPARTSFGASSITSADKASTTSTSVSSGSSSLSPTTNGSSSNRSPSVSVTSAPATSSSALVKATATASSTVSTSTTTNSPIANRSPAGSVSAKSAAASAPSTTASPAKPTSSTASSISSQSAPSLSVPNSTNRSPAGSTSISTNSTSTAKTTTPTPSISVSPASSSNSKPATTSTVSSASRSPAGSVSAATTKFTSSTATSSLSTTPKTESIVERELREQREKEEELQAARERAKATAASAPNVTSKPATSVIPTETNLKPTSSGRSFGKSISVNSATKEVPVQPSKATVSVKPTASTAIPAKTTSPPPGESIIEREMREQREKEAELQAQRNSAKPTAVVAPVTASPSAPSKDQTKTFDSSSAKADEERARVEAIERDFLSSAKKSSGTLPGPSKVANERPRLVSAMPNLYAPKNQTVLSTPESNSVATSSTSAAATTTSTAVSIQKTPTDTGETLAGRRTVSPAIETPTSTSSPDKQALGRIRATTAASSSTSQPIATSAPMDSMPPRASIFIQEDPTSSTPTEFSSPPVSVTTSSESSATNPSSQAPLSQVSAPGRPSSPPPVDWNSTSTKNPDLTSVLPSVPQNSAATPSVGVFDIDSALLAARSASAPVVATSVSNAAVASSSNGQVSSAVATEYADDVIEPALGEEDEEMTRAMRRATTNLRRVNVAKVEQGHQGWLKRRDRTATIKLFWTSLWFSLKDSRLLYYKEAPGKNSLATEHLPDGFLSLQFIDSIRISSSSEKKFIVEGQGVKWDLKCSTKEEAADWVEALNDAVTVHNLTERTRRTSLPVFGQDHAEDMVMEGTLNRQTTFGWQSNYWLLQDGMLFYFASQGGKRLGRIPLYHCEFAPYEMSSSKDAIRAFCITTYQNESIILAAKDEMEMHRWLNCMLRQRIVIEEAIDMISF